MDSVAAGAALILGRLGSGVRPTIRRSTCEAKATARRDGPQLRLDLVQPVRDAVQRGVHPAAGLPGQPQRRSALSWAAHEAFGVPIRATGG